MDRNGGSKYENHGNCQNRSCKVFASTIKGVVVIVLLAMIDVVLVRGVAQVGFISCGSLLSPKAKPIRRESNFGLRWTSWGVLGKVGLQ